MEEGEKEYIYSTGGSVVLGKLPMPFKNIKDIIKNIMTCYSISTKDNKRNGIELWQGNTGLNTRKNFLTAKVIKH